MVCGVGCTSTPDCSATACGQAAGESKVEQLGSSSSSVGSALTLLCSHCLQLWQCYSCGQHAYLAASAINCRACSRPAHTAQGHSPHLACIAFASMCSISTVSTSQPLANSRTASGSRKEPNCRAGVCEGRQQHSHQSAGSNRRQQQRLHVAGCSAAVQQQCALLRCSTSRQHCWRSRIAAYRAGQTDSTRASRRPPRAHTVCLATTEAGQLGVGSSTLSVTPILACSQCRRHS